MNSLVTALVLVSAFAVQVGAQDFVKIDETREPMQTGKFAPNWESLRQYQVPEWFRDAKFGIWAHWGPQCAPEAGDWYARHMYVEGHWQNQIHLKKYGHPAEFGFKDVIHTWRAENWNPEELVALYKRAGAQYFFAMANHHDNLDLWASAYQPWNSVAMGPKTDIVAGWAKAAREQGLKFGVSVHAAHAWLWYESAQGADREGPHAGVPYDAKLTAADGKGKWWEGFDPQELYAQSHEPSPNFTDANSVHARWNWGNGASLPDAAYCNKFYDRTIDLVNKYQPDLLYFDDTALPLWPISDAGLKIAAHYYNSSMKFHGGRLEAVLFGKILDETQRQCMVWDIERGASNEIEPFTFQTDTCLGGWHYERAIYDRHGYKSATTVIHMLADIVSKNGNLLLNVPVRSDGTIDEQERAIVEAIGEWNAVNGEAIFGTRPWKVYGEGPALQNAAPLSAQGFNEGKVTYSAADIRFTSKGKVVYAILLGIPAGDVIVKSWGQGSQLLDSDIASVQLLGSDSQVEWSQEADGLHIKRAKTWLCAHAVVYRIEPR